MYDVEDVRDRSASDPLPHREKEVIKYEVTPVAKNVDESSSNPCEKLTKCFQGVFGRR